MVFKWILKRVGSTKSRLVLLKYEKCKNKIEISLVVEEDITVWQLGKAQRIWV
jgi:hypothetical protein